jgi:hypothetical protein
MHETAGETLLIPVCSFRRNLQFVVHLVEQFFSFFGVTLHVPFVGFLRGGHFFVRLMAQPLRGGEVGMTSGRDVLFGLAEESAADDKRDADCSS